MRVAKLAEQIGFDSLWLVDHFLWDADPWQRIPAEFGAHVQPGGYGVREAWTTLAALAATTSTVRLGTLVTCTRYRNPGLLAKMADTVDEISDGRLVLGLGAGDYQREHWRFGYSSERPVSHFEEALAIIVPLLRTGSVDFDGQAYSAHLQLTPRPSRSTGPPILIGSLGNGPRILRLVARYADIWSGWIPDRSRADQVPALRMAVDAACVSHGRDPETVVRSVVVAVAFDGPMARRSGTISGSVDQVAASLRDFAAEGIKEIHVRLFPNDVRTVERFAGVITALRSPAIDAPTVE